MASELIESDNVHQDTDVQLIATNTGQMQVAQQQLVAWFEGKLGQARREFSDASDAQLAAQHAGLKTAPLTNMLKKAEKRIIYYEKCVEATRAGYMLVPCFPVEIFAVRTRRLKPRDTEAVDIARSESPKIGEGRYVDDNVFSRFIPAEKDGQRGRRVGVRFDEEIDFPMQLARAEVIDAARAAMQLKVFDEFAFTADSEVRSQSRQWGGSRGDPMLFGIIRHPSRSTHQDKATMFLIAWYIDTKQL